MDFLIKSTKDEMYERASAIEFFFSVLIVANNAIEVPRSVSRLIAITSLPVSDRE
jgi:hypothetical protein